MDDLPLAAGALLLVALAAFMGLAEASIGRVGRSKAHQLAQERKTRRAARLLAIAEDPAPFKNVMLLVSVAAQVFATAFATSYAIRRIGFGSEIASAGLIAVVLFVVAQVVPRTLAVQRVEATSLAAAPTVYRLGRVLGPVAGALIAVANATMVLLPGRAIPRGPFVTEEEIRHLVDVAEEEEEIEQEERELIHSIFEFGDTVVREVMVPRPDMVAIPADATVEQALETIVKRGYSRIPIYDGDTDNIVGVLYAKDVLRRLHQTKRSVKAKTLGRDPLFIPEQKKVAELLREMQEGRIHMAIVVDEYGGTAGLVTIEDLIEEIVGEIVDEYDREEPLVEPIDDRSMRVDAKMPIDEVNDLLGTDLPHDEWDTVGGLVFGLTGRVPAPGETVRVDSIELTTERVTGRRIRKVLITKGPARATEPQE